jgi:zinc/manganese transport system substrate-binding protein
VSPKLIQQIAEEGHIPVSGTLYSDALSSPETEAGTYLKMMTHNLGVLAETMGK